MKVLVSGASGFLGRYVVERLAGGREIVGTRFSEDAPMEDCRLERVDLSVPRQLADLIEAEEPDAVVHCAALARPDACEKDPALARAVNAVAAKEAARSASACGARFYYVSTDLVFDGRNSPYREEEPANPLGVYAKSKFEGERLVRAACPEALILRMSLLYGWAKAGRGTFTEHMRDRFSAGGKVTLFIDQKRAALYVRDAAEMIAQLVELGHDPGSHQGIFHLAGPGPVSRLRFGEMFCDVFGYDRALIDPIRMADMPLAAERPLDCSLDGERLFRLLRYRPRSVLTALRDMLVRVP